MRNYILGVVIVLFFTSCDTKEKAAMQSKIDSLSVRLVASQQVQASMNEVGILIDSIDASRKALQIRMVEGSSYADYVKRLQAINEHVQKTEKRLIELEQSATNTSKVSASSIRRLKADLAKRTEEIVELQAQLATLRNENLEVWAKVNHKDSLLLTKDQIIKVNESDIASLERLVNDSQAENKIAVANLYFDQAAALEMAANRTQFAPRKKKEARHEALELYKLSLTLGKLEAQTRIDELMKKLS